MQQFGTDLSLIQQLFPGRTRRQLKLKYKKEERKNPFMLHDALTNRSKGKFSSTFSTALTNEYYYFRETIQLREIFYQHDKHDFWGG